jgi:hypothetical protein
MHTYIHGLRFYAGNLLDLGIHLSIHAYIHTHTHTHTHTHAYMVYASMQGICWIWKRTRSGVLFCHAALGNCSKPAKVISIYIHAHIHTYIHTYICSIGNSFEPEKVKCIYIYAHIDMYICTYTHTYICSIRKQFWTWEGNKYINIFTYTYAASVSCLELEKIIRAYMHKYIRTYIHMKDRETVLNLQWWYVSMRVYLCCIHSSFNTCVCVYVCTYTSASNNQTVVYQYVVVLAYLQKGHSYMHTCIPTYIHT